MFARFACSGCHELDQRRKQGPGLGGVGQRLGRDGVLQAIRDPDAVTTEADPPYPKGIMKYTLTANGFYDRVSDADLGALVDYLIAESGDGDGGAADLGSE